MPMLKLMNKYKHHFQIDDVLNERKGKAILQSPYRCIEISNIHIVKCTKNGHCIDEKFTKDVIANNSLKSATPLFTFPVNIGNFFYHHLIETDPF